MPINRLEITRYRNVIRSAALIFGICASLLNLELYFRDGLNSFVLAELIPKECVGIVLDKKREDFDIDHLHFKLFSPVQYKDGDGDAVSIKAIVDGPRLQLVQQEYGVSHLGDSSRCILVGSIVSDVSK